MEENAGVMHHAEETNLFLGIQFSFHFPQSFNRG